MIEAKSLSRCLSLILLCLVSCTFATSYRSFLEYNTHPRHERLWPVNGTTSINFPQSSPFGPRQKASFSFRYDFHRGIDIPTPIGSPVYAIDDGIVRIDGEHRLYHDKVVQIQHYDSESDNVYYANYLHLLDSAVTGKAWNGRRSTFKMSMVVRKGDLLGHTDVDNRVRSTKPFPHLHFEIRENGRYQRNCCHPWKYLPTPTDVSERFDAEIRAIPNPDSKSCQVNVSVSVPPNRLTFNKVQLKVSSRDKPYEFDFCKANLEYRDPKILDDPEYKDFLTIYPFRFSSRSYSRNEKARYMFQFHDLPAGGYAHASACDVYGNCVHANQIKYTC